MKVERPLSMTFVLLVLQQKCIYAFTLVSVHEEKKPFKCAICDFCSATATKLVLLFMKERKNQNINFVINAFALQQKGLLDYHISSVHEEKKHLSNREICKKGKLH